MAVACHSSKTRFETGLPPFPNYIQYGHGHHFLLKSLPEEVGADIDGVKVGAFAFADDLVLTASTATGLQ